MPLHVVVFYTLLLVATGYAAARGGGPERAVALVLMSGTIATWAVAIGLHGSRSGHFYKVEYGVLLVDCAMLAALLGIALCADRFWPLWLTGLQGFGVVGHLAKALAPDILSNVYQAGHTLSAYPGLVLLIVATRAHRRRRRRDGHDRSWSTCWWRSIPRVRPAGPRRSSRVT